MMMVMMVWTLASAGSSAQMKTMATLPECTACIVMMIRVADDGGDDDGGDDDVWDDNDWDDDDDDLDNMVIANVLSGERPGVHQELPGLLPQQPHHRIAW